MFTLVICLCVVCGGFIALGLFLTCFLGCGLFDLLLSDLVYCGVLSVVIWCAQGLVVLAVLMNGCVLMLFGI